MTRIIELSMYELATGIIVRIASLPEDMIEKEVPTGYGYVAGLHDASNRRVDLKSGEVVPFQSERPSLDHEWDEGQSRWRLTEAARATIDAAQLARKAIATEEQLSLRAIRELLLDPDNVEARAKLQAIDDAIATRRPQIKQVGQDTGATLHGAT